MKTKQNGPQLITIGKKRAVVLDEAEYQRLREKADDGEPPLPPRSPNGTYPAREYLWVSIARTILRRRRALGWTQAELARRAGIRPKTLQGLEQGKYAPSVASVDKIDQALNQAEIDANLHDALESGASTPLTAADFKKIKREGRKRIQAKTK